MPDSIVELGEVTACVATAAMEEATETTADEAAGMAAGGAAAADDEADIPIPAVPFCCIAICIN